MNGCGGTSRPQPARWQNGQHGSAQPRLIPMTKKKDDPDETEGRALYRARAEALAQAQLAMGKRRVKLGDDKAPREDK